MATEADDVNSGLLGTLLTVLTIATLGIALVVAALVRSEVSEEHDKKDVSADRPYRDLVAEQRSKLDAPAAYLDRTKGLVSLPIERAMELTVEGLKKDPNSATPPAPAGAGTGGGAPDAASSGSGGSGGTTPGTTNPPPGEAPAGAVGIEKPTDQKPEKPGAEDKKKAPKKPAPVPAAPKAPAAPAPAPAPAPNGQ